MPGEIGILNVGAGDTKLVFDNANPDEMKKSAAIVTDMIRRGFVLLIEVGRDDAGPIYRRAKGFDEKAAEYIVAGVVEEEKGRHEQKSPAAPRRGRARKTETRIPAAKTKGVAVARTAGG